MPEITQLTGRGCSREHAKALVKNIARAAVLQGSIAHHDSQSIQSPGSIGQGALAPQATQVGGGELACHVGPAPVPMMAVPTRTRPERNGRVLSN